MNRVKVGQYYRYEPVGLDIWDPRTRMEAGTKVKVINLHGCPPANTMGHCYVDNLAGEFQGLVLCNSLVKISWREARE